MVNGLRNFAVVICTFVALLSTPAFVQSVVAAPSLQQDENAVLELEGCLENFVEFGFSEEFEFPEGTSGEVDLGFALNFYGQTFETIYVNENGNVTFDEPLGFFPFFDLPLAEIGTPIIAPFHANLTGIDEGAAVTYGAVIYAGRPAFCANWTNVSPDGFFFPPEPTASGAPVNTNPVDVVAAGLPGFGRLNTFQLIIVERSDVADGDFDLLFNYEQIDWDFSFGEFGEGDGEFIEEDGAVASSIQGEFQGEVPARSGYSIGTPFVPDTDFELPGSGVLNGFIDANIETGLVNNSLNSLLPGRYIFELRGGDAPAGQTISGEVVVDADGSPLIGAIVQLCLPEGQPCATTTTNAAGFYQLGAIPDGNYLLSVFPPGGSALLPNMDNPITVEGEDDFVEIALMGPTPPPPGTGIEPSRGFGSTPTVYWNDTLTVTTTGCPAGAATFALVQGASTFASGPMTEDPAGTYTATFGPLFPDHDEATVIMNIDCPDPEPDQETGFDIYIDPSGVISDEVTSAPVEGATAELFRSDSENGPYTLVPDGDAIMSPSNRINPFTTETDGRFGWDVVAGFYFVRASAPGCVDPGDASIPFVDTDILPVEPEWLGLELFLACAPELSVPADMSAEAAGADGATVAYAVTAVDAEDANPLVNCIPASSTLFPIGTTTVNCSASDASGNESIASFMITVADSTAPELTLPDDITVEATDPAGSTVDFSVSATDVVDNDVTVDCIPASGTLFPVGVSTVACTATDDAGNNIVGSFDVTVTFEAANQAPAITSSDAIAVVEGTVSVLTVEASDDTDSIGNGLAFSLGTEADSALFVIDADSGALSFRSPPAFGTPQDEDGNNVYVANVAVTDSGGLSDSQIISVTVTAAPVVGEPDVLYVSSSRWGEIYQAGAALSFTDEDILAFDLETEIWSKAFDASDVGLINNDLEAFHFLDEGSPLPSILMAFTHDRDIPGVGEVEPTDIVKFVPTALGEETAGSFELYLKGDLVGLDRYREHIDAITFTPDGRLVVSTKASLRVNGASGFLWGRSQDMIAINPDATWELYFDGSTAELTTKRENIWASWIDATTGEIYLSTREHFQVGDVTGRGATVPICEPLSLGQDSTACSYSLFWSAVTHNFTRHNIDGMHLGPALPRVVNAASVSAVDARAADLAAGDNEDDVELDELDSYLDEPEEGFVLPELYLPVVSP